MPIFEYECDDCSKRFEELVLSAPQAEPRCPECSSVAVRKLHSTFAAQSSSAGVACEGGFSESPGAGMCGACGGPGPCSMN